MAKNSRIEWTTHSFNPWRGCTRVSAACAHCYAARDAARFPHIRGVWGDHGTRIVAVPNAWREPLRWHHAAAAAATRPRVFCASLADVFEDWRGELLFPTGITGGANDHVPARWNGHELVREFAESAERQGLALATMDHAREELFRLIETTGNLDWLLLTKRPENVLRMVPESWRERFPANVWMGTTVENQAMAELRIPELLAIPARVRFLSMEPLLGPVSLIKWLDLVKHQKARYTPEGPGNFEYLEPPTFHPAEPSPFLPPEPLGLHWIITGGESGPGARPAHPQWYRSLRDQCAAARVPFHFKQWGEWVSVSEVAGEGPIHEFPDLSCVRRIGKAAAGRTLDGVTWDEFPEG